MVIFHSYVSLPEGIRKTYRHEVFNDQFQWGMFYDQPKWHGHLKETTSGFAWDICMELPWTFCLLQSHVLRLELLFPELECGPLLCALACSAYRSFQVPGVYFPKLPEAPKSSIANDQESSIWDHHLFFWKSFPFLMFFQKVCWFSWYPLVN